MARKPPSDLTRRAAVAETNQDRMVTRLGYDGAGQMTSVTNAFGNTEQTSTQYDYHEAGNLSPQIDALNRTNTFAYDWLGRRIQHTMPGGQRKASFMTFRGT